MANAGSIGMPYGRSGGHWLLLRDGQVQLRRVEFDLDDAVEAVARQSGFHDCRSWAEHYIRAVTTDAEAVAVFGPRDGRNAT